MVLILVCAAILFALMFPETPTGRFAKRHFVDAPAQWLNGFNPVKLFALVAFIAAITVCSVAFPPGMALVVAGDLAAYMEIVAAFALLISRLRFRQTVSYFTIILRQVPPLAHRLAGVVRKRVRRRRQNMKAKSGSPDEGRRLVLAYGASIQALAPPMAMVCVPPFQVTIN